MTPSGGRLILCGTPIGNLDDATFRLVATLERVDAIACEDARRTRKLLSHFGIAAPDLIVLNDGNERRVAPKVVSRIAAGSDVALVSDAGMPALSDPGYHLVRACLERDLRVEIVPGPTAVVTALSVSGLPPARFVFEGFLPRKSGERERRVQALASEQRTLIFFCSPHRVEADLETLLSGLGDRPAALARELTKLHEEVRRDTLSGLLAGLRDRPLKGEVVLVVSGAVPGEGPVPEGPELARRARELMDRGVPRREALLQVAKETGAARRDVFDALVEADEKAGGQADEDGPEA
ncbi:MAG: 16S rRNA (cytidine(1402)-2'-O)-methyltransferase [Actinomycetota bacterium]|nr:16S rRNA (cytidine(1402)-2'-O)-methyltransferase [Actinomycetota bacterium]